MAPETAAYYDRYWEARDAVRTASRSRERAAAAVTLLRDFGLARGRLLDAGCGPGWALEQLRDAGYEVLGVDASPRAVEEARSRGLDARCLDLEHEAPEGSFDAVVCLEVLEHLAAPLEALRRLRAATRPGGPVVVSLPNELHAAARLRMLIGRLPCGGHDNPHLRHFDRRHARRLFAAAGERVARETTIDLLPPRWPFLRALSRPFLAASPGLFSLAAVYLLVPGAGAEAAP